MNKIKKINEFLHLIAEISKSGVIVDPNLVYSNLIRNSSKSIFNYFYDWQDKACKIPNIKAFVSPTWEEFFQFRSLDESDDFDMFKIYIPFDESHMYDGVNRLMEYLSKNDITHKTLVSSSIRLDGVSVRVSDPNDIDNIIRFIYSDEYLREGLMEPNPFMFTAGCTSITWDGNLSYNMCISEWISQYINSIDLDKVSYESFYEFVTRRYKEIFQVGNGITSFKMTTMELANYQRITELLLIALRKDRNVSDLYKFYKFVTSSDSKKEVYENIERLKRKEKRKPAIDDSIREAFDYVFYQQSIKNGVKSAIETFKMYSKDGNIRLFTRRNGVRTLVSEMIDADTASTLVFEEQKQALITSAVETLKKYDPINLGRALFGIKNGDYQSFTNDDNSRERLMLWVKPDEIDELIHNTLIDEGCEDINSSEEYWLFMELMGKLVEKAR